MDAEIVVGTDGSLKSLKFDGKEQDPSGNCMDKYLPFVEDFYANTTGQDQVVRFRLSVGR